MWVDDVLGVGGRFVFVLVEAEVWLGLECGWVGVGNGDDSGQMFSRGLSVWGCMVGSYLCFCTSIEFVVIRQRVKVLFELILNNESE